MDDLILIDDENIKQKIYTIRGIQVMIDSDLAKVYGVETRVLNQAVKRNLTRFPSQFMFQLNKDEFENWKSQFVMSNYYKMGLKKITLCFYRARCCYAFLYFD